MGDYIRKTRIERGIIQEELAKELGINSVNLSMWELNRKPSHPKYTEKIISFLKFIPKLKSNFDRLGTRTELHNKFWAELNECLSKL